MFITLLCEHLIPLKIENIIHAFGDVSLETQNFPNKCFPEIHSILNKISVLYSDVSEYASLKCPMKSFKKHWKHVNLEIHI